MGLSDCLGGIWEINFSLPPRDGPGCQVRDGAVDGVGVRPWAAAGCQQLVEQEDRGVGADCRPGPQRVLPAGLEGLDQHARDRIREITGRERLLVPTEVIVTELNLFLRGWAGVLPLRKLGPCPRPGRELRPLAARAVVVQERQPAPRLAVGRNPGAAITRSPGPGQPPSSRHPAQALPGLAREGRTPPVKNVGKPCAGEPHARFDGRGLETGRYQRNRASPRPS